MEATEIISLFSLLALLGVLQGCMQGIMFYDAFAYFDKLFPKGFKWFSNNQTNKHNWVLVIFNREYKIFSIFPFIAFTDFFHLCHCFFGLCLGGVCMVLFPTNIFLMKIFIFVASAILYSTAFELILRLTKKLQNKNG